MEIEIVNCHKKRKIFKIFDRNFISTEVKLVKPDIKFYKHAILTTEKNLSTLQNA